MNAEKLKQILLDVADGELSIQQAIQRLRAWPFEQTSMATIDHHRAVRCGHPEVIFGPGKSAEQVVEIAKRLSSAGSRVLATRLSAEQLEAIRTVWPAASTSELARAALIGHADAHELKSAGPSVAVVSAGTSDASVAEEALFTLEAMQVPTHRIHDVGVAGLHRLLAHVPKLQQCCALIVVAGMEGALPSVVGGLVAAPVFAVPTSVGYGVSLSGLTALFAMLNSCSSNVSVVNIDNGFGAAFSAAMVYGQVGRSG